MSVSQKRLRSFSDEFKRSKVKEIEQGKSTMSQVSREYQVSFTSVSRWMKKYGSHYEQGVRVIVEQESDTRKLLQLQTRIAELERLVGQKQIQLDFKEKMIDLAEEYYQVDIKKKFDTSP